MRTNPAPPLPAGGLSQTENKRRYWRYVDFLQRWFRAIEQRWSAKYETPAASRKVLWPKIEEKYLVPVKRSLAALRDHPPWHDERHGLYLNDLLRIKGALRDLEAQMHHSARVDQMLKANKVAYPYTHSIIQRVKDKFISTARYFPTAARLYKKRLLVALREHLNDDINFKKLQEAGIPAKVLAPWADDPRAYVREHPHMTQEYNADLWIQDIGLDSEDRPLVEWANRQMAETGRRPSREQARQFNHHLQNARRNQQNETQRPAIQRWLDQALEHWTGHLPAGWYLITDADDVLDRSQKDGLCLADTLAGERWGEDYDLAFVAAQRNGRTVVGLNHRGQVRSHHHCTGKDNKFDPVAFELFSKPRIQTNPPRYLVTLRRGQRLMRVRV